MAAFAVFYTYDDRAAERDVHRPAHRDFLRQLLADGVILAAGPYADEATPGALLLVRADSAEIVRETLAADPFVALGLATEIDIREWTVVMGPFS